MSDPSAAAPEPNRPLAKAAEDNIRTVVQLERDAARRRSPSERASDSLLRVMGSMAFVLTHLAVFLLWFLWNSSWIPGLVVFDPFPFGILTLVVSAEGVLLAIFVLVNQNRMSREADHRAHLDLQISLLAEAESTKTLALLRDLARSLGYEPRPEDDDLGLVEATSLPELAEGLREQLEDSGLERGR